MEENVKKLTYNPFKLFGSYIGVVLYMPVMSFLTGLVLKNLYSNWYATNYSSVGRSQIDFVNSFNSGPLVPIAESISGCYTEIPLNCLGAGLMAIFIWNILIGFVLGYLIHLLIRGIYSKIKK